ncbi:MAG: sigma-70 family RNA polymerase sigma factor [Sedimentisphaerales bacterium]|nr:sigma-70 family RNA polymerase sigma factor [Sedimentisphaerales bacterium]
MRKIKNPNLAQLLMQLRFAPERKRYKQLAAAEKLFAIIDKDKEYPFEFVCFKITGYRLKDYIARELIKGSDLADDLPIFIARLSAQLGPLASRQQQKVYDIQQLAEALGVSTKTINRWRRRGLLAQKFVFDDGSKRLGFFQSTVDAFIKANPALTAKAKAFTRLTKKQKQQIIRQAHSLSAKPGISRHQIIEKIAAKTAKAHETIRYTLLNYEKSHPGGHAFKESPSAVDPGRAAEIYRLFKQGSAIKELMEQFNRSRSSIYRIIDRGRAKALLTKKIEFINSPEFLSEDAARKILAKPIGAVLTKDRLFPDSPGLNRETEADLFRRYNYLKFLSSLKIAALVPGRPSGKTLSEIENYLAQAETIKKIIIEANLSLVVSVAKKHSISGANLPDLISEGNLSLMRAVEKFDYTRGFRFATYASWAIAKDYARKIPAEFAQIDISAEFPIEDIQRDLRTTGAATVVNIERARRSLIKVISDNLDDREQYIILNHFGLVGSKIKMLKKEKKTLQQIGKELQLTKERVRQLELAALQKLKHLLSTEEFDLLTA